MVEQALIKQHRKLSCLKNDAKPLIFPAADMPLDCLARACK
jgi:hypothetical protein